MAEGLVAAMQSSDLRIVLMGRTGSGKSSSGNTILGKKAFDARASPSSVTSECSKATVELDGQRTSVIDTPGIFDTKYSEAQLVRELNKCISLSSPGPHVFLIVMDLQRFTKEVKDTVAILTELFGTGAEKHCMILFAHGDNLEGRDINDYLSESLELQQLIAQCNDNYHVFNNKDTSRRQVQMLLQKINQIVKNNGGGHYTNSMFQEAELVIQEQTKSNLKKIRKRKRRNEEDLKARLTEQQYMIEWEKLQLQYAREAREKAERKNKYIISGFTNSMAIGGALVGVVVGGPLGVAVGTALGGLAGRAMGTISVVAAEALDEHCIMQ